MTGGCSFFRAKVNKNIGIVFVDHFLEAIGLRNNQAFIFLPAGNTCAENLHIGVTEFFCLTGRKRTQRSGRPSAIKDQQSVFILWQDRGAFVRKLTIR